MGMIIMGAVVLAAIISYVLSKRRESTNRRFFDNNPDDEFDFENFPVPCCVIDGKGIIVNANSAWLETLKLKKSRITGVAFTDILVAGYQNQFKLFLAQFDSNPSPEKLVTEVQKGDGVITTCQLCGKATYLKKGAVSRIVLTLEDFSNLGGSDIENFNDDIRFKLLFDKSTDPILLIDNGVYIDCNEAALKLLGFKDKTALLGKRPVQYAPKFQPNGQLSSEMEQQMIKLAIEKGGHHFEWTRYNAAGEQIIVDVSMSVIPYRGGNIIFTILRDITEQKFIEEKLRASEEKYRVLIENANEAILVVQDDIIKFANTRTAELIRRELSTLINKPFIDYIYPDDRGIFLQKYPNNQDYSRFTGNYKLRVICGNQSIKWLDVNTVKISWEGKPAALIFASDITERKNVEEKLRESQRVLRTVLDNIPIRVFWKDTEFKYLGCNRAFVDDTGLGSISEVIGKSDLELSWKNNADRYHADDIQIIKTGVPKFDYEEPLTMPDGSDRIIRINKVPLKDNAGRTIGILGSYQDITAEKRAKEALAESKRRLADVINFLPDATFVIDKNGVVIAWNLAMEKMTGVSSSDILGKGNYEYAIPFYGEKRPILIDMALIPSEKLTLNYSSVVRHDETICAETHIDNLAGREVYLWCIATPLRDSRGNVVGAIESIRDITQIKSAEIKIRASEEKYRGLIETAPVTMWSYDIENGKLLIISPNVEKLTGYTVDEFMKKPSLYRELLTRESLEQIAQSITKLVRTKTPISLENKIIHRDGSLKTVSLLLSPGFGSADAIKRIEGVIIDITEKKRLEEQITHSEKMAAIGVLAAGVAHEFNNLLCGIIGNLSLIQNNRDDNDLFKKALDDAVRAADQATELVQSLLSYSGRKGNEGMGEVNLTQILKDIVRLISKELKDKNIHLITNYNETPPIYGSSNQLQQVFLNILINAIHAVAENGIISISIWHDIENAYVEISDNGIGISKENLDKIFDPFYSTKGVWGPQKAKGTGLGLSISNNIVGNHGGKIQVRSIEGIGTEFTVLLPINSGHSISVTSKNSINQYKRVTIIDFNQKNANHLSDILKKLGSRCETLRWGEELIAQGNMFNSDLVVLDASHPGLIDFARTINYLKKNYPSIAILLSSAGLIRHEFEEYIRQADGIIYKPYTEEEVIKVLAQISSKHTRADTDIKIDV